jgi:hypothetical protein
MDRRKVLSGAVLGGAAIVGASAFGSFSPEDVFADEQRSSVDPGAPDPDFAEGRIKSIDGNTFRATGTDGTMWTIRVAEATSVWKLTPTSFDKVKVGDGMYARGARLDDGTLAADSVWANIVNLKAHLVSIKDKKLELDHNGDKIVGHVVSGTTAAVYNNTPAVSDLSMLKVDSHIQVLGAWIPDTNEVEISTVYAAV